MFDVASPRTTRSTDASYVTAVREIFELVSFANKVGYVSPSIISMARQYTIPQKKMNKKNALLFISFFPLQAHFHMFVSSSSTSSTIKTHQSID